MSKLEILSKLPAVDELLRCAELTDLRDSLAHGTLADWIRESIERVRRELLNGCDIGPDELQPRIVALVRLRLQADARQAIQPVINATGILLHTNIGRAPLAELALERMRGAAAYTNLELDLETGQRGRRGARVMGLLAQLSGAEDALVVNNCAGATVLVLQALASGREVIISRGQLVEIGGGFRLPEVFQAAGVILREVGTTNRTYLRDYEAAIGPSTGAVLRVHRSNFAQLGFVVEPGVKELAALHRPPHVPMVDDVGSGCLYDLSKFGLLEPTVTESIRCGSDLCLFSGDKLFGGPQCGMIVGKKLWVDRLRSSPMMRALRADKVTLAALEATAEIHLSGQAFDRLPVLRMLSKDAEEIRVNCESVRERLAPSARERVSVIACQSQIGGGALPGQVLPSYALCVGGLHLETLSRSLRLGAPAILGRLSEDRLILDLRTVAATDLDPLADRLSAALLGDAGGSA